MIFDALAEFGVQMRIPNVYGKANRPTQTELPAKYSTAPYKISSPPEIKVPKVDANFARKSHEGIQLIADIDPEIINERYIKGMARLIPVGKAKEVEIEVTRWPGEKENRTDIHNS